MKRSFGVIMKRMLAFTLASSLIGSSVSYAAESMDVERQSSVDAEGRLSVEEDSEELAADLLSVEEDSEGLAADLLSVEEDSEGLAEDLLSVEEDSEGLAEDQQGLREEIGSDDAVDLEDVAFADGESFASDEETETLPEKEQDADDEADIALEDSLETGKDSDGEDPVSDDEDTDVEKEIESEAGDPLADENDKTDDAWAEDEMDAESNDEIDSESDDGIDSESDDEMELESDDEIDSDSDNGMDLESDDEMYAESNDEDIFDTEEDGKTDSDEQETALDESARTDDHTEDNTGSAADTDLEAEAEKSDTDNDSNLNEEFGMTEKSDTDGEPETVEKSDTDGEPETAENSDTDGELETAENSDTIEEPDSEEDSKMNGDSAIAENSDTDEESDMTQKSSIDEESGIIDEESSEIDEESDTDGASAPFDEEAVLLQEESGEIESIETENGKEEGIVEVDAEFVTVRNVDLADSDELFEEYLESLMYPEEEAVLQEDRGELLGETDHAIYEYLKAGIMKIASGQRDSSEFTISTKDFFGQEKFTPEELGVDPALVNGKISSEAVAALQERLSWHPVAIVRALLLDLPYEFYWFDKTKGYSYSTGVSCSYSYSVEDQIVTSITPGDHWISFSVSSDYSQSGERETYLPSMEKTGAASNSVAYAQDIVDEAISMSDYDKLVHYRERICAETSYNHDAVNNNAPYGDPWQIIYAFDKDPETKIVCEGYSKAFKYLCDLTEFSSNKIECYLATGTMNGGTGAGNHMWNVIHMNDDKNYMVDVTNCDEGSIGADDRLFLVGYKSGSLGSGYVFGWDSYQVGNLIYSAASITYTYDDFTREKFSDEELTLSSEDYDPSYQEQETPSGNTCGDNCTWVLENGILTISGTGTVIKGGWDKEAVTSLVIGDGITEISSNTFEGCAALETATLPASLSTVGKAAFSSCGALADIHYQGSKSGWDGITINNDENANTVLYQATIHCQDGDIGLFKVFFHANDGRDEDIVEELSLARGHNAIKLPSGPENAKRIFQAWCTKESESADGAARFAENDTEYNEFYPDQYTDADGKLHLYALWQMRPGVMLHANFPDGTDETVFLEASDGGSSSVRLVDQGEWSSRVSGKLIIGWAASRDAAPGDDSVLGTGTDYQLPEELEEAPDLYAVWAKECAIRLYRNLDAADEETEVRTGLEGTKLTLGEPFGKKQDGRDFIGFSANRNANPSDEGIYKAGDEYTVQNDADLYAVWSSTRSFDLVFHANYDYEGEQPESLVYTEEEGTEVRFDSGKYLAALWEGDGFPVILRDEYELVGWSPDSAAEPGDEDILTKQSSFTVSKNMEFYAVWRRNVKVTFDPNGGYFRNIIDGNIDIERITEPVIVWMGQGSDFFQNLAGRFIVGYDSADGTNMVFSGWAYDAAGKEMLPNELSATEDVVVYGVWRAGIPVRVDMGEYFQSLNADGRYIDFYASEGKAIQEKPDLLRYYTENLIPEGEMAFAGFRVYLNGSGTAEDGILPTYNAYVPPQGTKNVFFEAVVGTEDLAELTFYGKDIRNARGEAIGNIDGHFFHDGGADGESYAHAYAVKGEKVNTSLKAQEGGIPAILYSPEYQSLYQFLGWATEENGQDIVDFDSLVITGDMAFYPVINKMSWQVGDEYFEAADEAIEAANESGKTLILLRDSSEGLLFPEGSDVELNLNGFSIDAQDGIGIRSQGSLSIKGEGSIYGEAGSLRNTGTVRIEGESISFGKTEGVNVPVQNIGGTMDVLSGEFQCGIENLDGGILKFNGGNCYGECRNAGSGSRITVSDGYFWKPLVQASDNGEIEIIHGVCYQGLRLEGDCGGSIHVSGATPSFSGEIRASSGADGTGSGNGRIILDDGDYYGVKAIVLEEGSSAELLIHGGSYWNLSPQAITIEEGSSGSVKIDGGGFGADFTGSEYLSEGLYCKKMEDDYWHVLSLKDFSDCDVELEYSSSVYDGTAKTPAVTVKDGGKTLSAGTDYAVTYADNVNIGTATVTLTGKGNYSGTIKKSFTITAKPLSGLTVSLSSDSFVYDGTAKTPAVTVKDGGRTLSAGTDYAVSYADNVNVGTATVTLTGKGNYSGTIKKSFTITAKPLSGLTVSLSSDSFVYDGTAKTPAVTVKDGGRTLSSGTDYTVSYADNVNVGTATVTLTGKGNYSGTIKKSFTITAKPLSGLTVSLSSDSFVYDGTAKTPAVTVKDGSRTLSAGTDYTVSYADNANVGTATVTLTGKGNYSGTIKKSFTITAKALAEITVSLSSDSFVYDGTAKTPAVTARDGSRTLLSGTDYTVTYANNVNAGTATATLTGKGNYGGTITEEFAIEKAAQPLTVVLKESLISVGKKTGITAAGNEGTLSYKSEKTSIATVTSKGAVTARKVGTVKITVTAAATTNYEEASKELTLKVTPAASSSLSVNNTSSGVKLSWKKVSGAQGYYIYRNNKKIATIKKASTLSYTDKKAKRNGTTYKYKVSAYASTGEGELSAEKPICFLSVPKISSAKNSSSKKLNVKWKKNANATGYEVRYVTGKTEKIKKIKKAGTVSCTISGLKKNKTYKVSVRSYKTVGKKVYYSPWSAAKSVKIKK